ncbi:MULTISPECIES: urease accessory protein UreD [Streptomyces]|uniref:urease accessory protein UreD n=1 Tax=Streptomyces TaxID=1883 RepID=UPI00163B705C|nr:MULTISPECIES: urease accessory protein UreD [Streptomyces]MBC2876419.1 urease accessory protein UreD [Streptomyces sp. TYQ1024]UBI35368.1 urease accessory protein UreD [Streptomyces mobaraensis]UKW27959.1 urease accessory protein UreD [Streptomyces sp. TYQ1024]
MTTAPIAGPRPPAAAVRAAARLVAAPDGRGSTALPVLAGEAPFALRRTGHRGPVAHVALVGAMSAPLGGDRLTLTATVEPGAALRFTTTAATLALPGRTGAPAAYDIRITVGDGATLHWLPEPLISAAGSDLRTTTRVELAPTARLVLREEQVLGRTGERPGRLTARLTVRRAGRPLLDQELAYGPGAPGWEGGAVLGGHRAVGQLLVVDPDFGDTPPAPALPPGEGAVAAAMPLAGPAVVVSAVASDALRLRALLRTAERALTDEGDAGRLRRHPA